MAAGTAGSDCLAQLRALLVQLDGSPGQEEVSRICKELLKLGPRWPQEALEEEGEAFERLTAQLAKFADGQQQDIVAAFRPLREDVRQRMADATAALNNWLSEEKASSQRLVELLQGIDDAPQMRWYKQCPDLGVKAHFLLALAALARAASTPGTPLRSRAGGQPRALALLQRLTERFFVIPEHGDVLGTWHDGRLECYNATLWRAAKRAADRLKDDLQVRLVSALRRATAPVQPVLTGGKAKPQLQLELHQWPMVSCPLARAFLDFVAQRGPELGDLGQPALSECPPHTLLPSTLRKLLGRLDAFEVLDGEASQANPTNSPEKLGCERVGVVRLRWEAVAALAFKAVGTKPKASSMAVAPSAAPAGGKEPGSNGVRAGGLASGRSPGARPDGAADGDAEGGGPPKLARRRIDWSNVRALKRLVRRGLRASDEDWRQAWHQFCKQRRVPAEQEGLLQSSPSREVLAEFIERNLQILLRKEWAKDLMYRVVGRPDEMMQDSEREDVPGADGFADGGAAGKGKPKELSTAAALAAAAGAAAAAARRRGAPGRDDEASSSNSESSRSKQRRKKRRRDKRKLGMMGYGDYFPRGQGDIHISPEVMMMNMNQMMGMSMMMNSPLAMMGMGAPMMTQMPLLPTAGLKMKKDDKAKRDKPEDKTKKDASRETSRKEKGDGAAGGGAAGAAGGGANKAMIDADDL